MLQNIIDGLIANIDQLVVWSVGGSATVPAYFVHTTGQVVASVNLAVTTSPVSLLQMYRTAVSSTTAVLPTNCVVLSSPSGLQFNTSFVSPASSPSTQLPAGKYRFGGVSTSAAKAFEALENGARFASLSASTSGSTAVVAAVPGRRIRVLAYNLVAAGSTNVKFQSASTDITGLKYFTTNTGIVAPYNPVGWFQTAVGEALNVHLSASQAIGGELVYIEVTP